ncbi:helicase-associated domain-containing protein [Microbacterium sp. BK668]|uniref:helicase-associated domain-containing protein n=1 Tax=Microbacterium sp. BK668 TaxID=2512118 RepID=UPI0010621B0F|nr:helicase-associated domain-containing protein [Microbacterium sp. BK668]TDN92192.1 XPB/Ssl2-like helicase family protein [Microbacterium sp. BK668]
MTTDERALATWLSARADAELTETFALRSVSASTSWHDFFDAAAGLLDAASVDRALTRLPRSALAALASGSGADRPELSRMALVDENGAPYAAVAERVAVAKATAPAAFEARADASAPPPADDPAAAAAAERVLATTGALADLLIATQHTPLSRTGTGTVSAVDRKRLVEAGAVATPEDLDDLVQAADAAGLLESPDREWVASEAADEWLEAPTTVRWSRVVEGFRAALRPGLRTAAGGYLAPAEWATAYPLDPEWDAEAVRLERIAVRWGLVTPDGAEPRWAAPLRAGAAPDAASLAALLPAEIDRVYLQADLSAIAPGPLAPALDLRLRRIAVRESRAQASTYRFTSDSLGAGMTEGETAESIRDFLARLSLTGIPQPLEYLLASTASRHGLVRVRVGEHGNTVVESADPSVLGSIAVDQALRPLGLVQDGAALVTRVSRDVVYWSLADARYPVVAMGPAGDPESVSRRRRAGAAVAETDARPFAALLSRLRDTHETDADAAWLGRELEQAVRARSVIHVAVHLPDGSERTFTLEATGLGGGRLRGRDRGADIERTLPVSSIVSVKPA